MTTKEKQGFGLYFLLAFGLAWLCQVGGCMALLQKQNAVLYQLALVAPCSARCWRCCWCKRSFCASPPASAGRCRASAATGWRRGSARRYLRCWPQCSILRCSRIDWPLRQLAGSGLRRRDGRSDPAQELGVSNLSYMLETGLFAVTLAPVINMFAALGEEAGWRGI